MAKNLTYKYQIPQTAEAKNLPTNLDLNNFTSVIDVPFSVTKAGQFDYNRGSEVHQGLDLAVPQNTPIYAPADGVVVSAGRYGDAGNETSIYHGTYPDGSASHTVIDHQTTILVQPGEFVKQGQLIGYSGNTGTKEEGTSGGMHVHLQEHVGGNAPGNHNVDPHPILKNKPGTHPKPTGAAEGKASNPNVPAQVTQFSPNIEPNVINNYRNWTYNFALGVLPADARYEDKIDPVYIEKNLNRYHIIDTSGKSGKGDQRSSGLYPEAINADATNAGKVKKIIDGFNSSSPGRFDFYIDNFEMNTTVADAGKIVGLGHVQSIKFTVFEPYGINGFPEVVEVAALAAGYPTYLTGAFVLKIWFTGYNDSSDFSKPEVIPDSTRYYIMGLTKIGVTVDETGAKYQVEAVNYSDLHAYGPPNKHMTTLSCKGSTVFESLKDYFKKLNEAVKKEKDLATNNKAKVYDIYEISCPKFPDLKKKLGIKEGLIYSPVETTPNSPTTNHSEVAFAKIMNPDKTKVANATAPMTTSKKDRTYQGAKKISSGSSAPQDTKDGAVPELQFDILYTIDDVITNIILHSDYGANIIANNKDQKADDYFKYFKIRILVDNLEFDLFANRYARKYTYIIDPFKVHNSAIPNNTQAVINYESTRNDIVKEYSYIYTGKNTDILKFELTYNNLWVNAMPQQFAQDPESLGLKLYTGPAQINKTIDTKSAKAEDVKNSGNSSGNLGNTPKAVFPYEQTITLKEIINDDNPYTKLALMMHEGVLNGWDKQANCNLEILGDPYFLLNNQYASGAQTTNQKNADGSAPVVTGGIFINLWFRSPVDASNSVSPSLAQFNYRDHPMSGIWKVNSVKNSFNGGMFTQELSLTRMPAQIVGNNNEIVTNGINSAPSDVPGDTVRKDNADITVNKFGIKPDAFNISKTFNLNLPGVPLPGSTQNYQTSFGAVAVFGGLFGAGTSRSGLNFSAASVASAGDPNASIVVNSAQLLNQTANLQNPASSFADFLTKSSPSVSPTLTQNVLNLDITSSAAIGNNGSTVKSLLGGSPSDPFGTAAAAGLDPNVLSGLSPQLQGQITQQLDNIGKSVPPNTDIKSLETKGVVFANLTSGNLKNLPPSQPSVTAPSGFYDPARGGVTAGNGNVDSLLNGKFNVADLTSVPGVPNPPGLLAAGVTDFGSAAQTTVDKFTTVQSAANNVIGSALNVSNPVGSLAQNDTVGITPASVGLGSVESNKYATYAVAQYPSDQTGFTLNSQVGSNQTSPLTNLFKTTNVQGA